MAESAWVPIEGGITAPKGFKASGIVAGLKPSCNPDLALLLAPKGSVCAGTFTQSLVRAACVDLCIQRLKSKEFSPRAVLVNSGQANACTGERGLIDSIRATEAVALLLGISPEEILISSTGVIGSTIPMDKLLRSLEPLVKGLSKEGGHSAAKAILTTDLIEKEIALEADLGGRKVRIGGMAKGSGMIHPNMATMLAYITCDVSMPKSIWEKLVFEAVENSFNSITIDGDTSTNDSLIAFAFGDPLLEKHLDELQVGLRLVAQHLAKAIARDGEGANCLLEVKVVGTTSANDARQIARVIAGSSLVKTAIHGCDPNWGRIVAAAGRAGVPFEENKVALWIGPFKLLQSGKPIAFNVRKVSQYIKQKMKGKYLVDDCVKIEFQVGSGSGSGRAWGCDLSDQYIRINADYTT